MSNRNADYCVKQETATSKFYFLVSIRAIADHRQQKPQPDAERLLTVELESSPDIFVAKLVVSDHSIDLLRVGDGNRDLQLLQ